MNTVPPDDDFHPELRRIDLGPVPGHEGTMGTLKVIVVPDEEFGCILYSRWKPTEEELLALSEGASVWLGICGQGHPGVQVITDLAWTPEVER